MNKTDKKEPRGIIRLTDPVKVKIVRNEIEVSSLATCNRKPVIRRYSKGRHVDTRTGEIFESKVNKTRGESLANFRASQQALKDLIKENTTNHDKILLITLTYGEKQTEISQCNRDFNRFIEKMRNKYVQFGRVEYVNVIEPNPDNDGLHIHAILFFHQSPTGVLLSNNEMQRLWVHGFTDMQRPFDKQEVYGYLTPHPVKKVTDKNRHMHAKALRLLDMPACQRLYRASKGLRRPVIYTDNYENVKQYIKENEYEYKSERAYLNPGLKTLRGNKIYHVTEKYEKELPKS